MNVRRGCWSGAILLAWVAILPQGLAQSDPSPGSEVQAADAELNAVYRQLMTSLPPADRERLRAAERAWIAFTEKNYPAFRTWAAKRNMPPARLASASLAEIRARRDTLRLMLDEADVSRDQLSRQLDQADSALNAAYKLCLASLDKGDAAMLREAQRAWITFRDAQARAKNPLITSLRVINRRTAELQEFYLGAAPAPAYQPAQRNLPTPQYSDRIIPDPFERAR